MAHFLFQNLWVQFDLSFAYHFYLEAFSLIWRILCCSYSEICPIDKLWCFIFSVLKYCWLRLDCLNLYSSIFPRLKTVPQAVTSHYMTLQLLPLHNHHNSQSHHCQCTWASFSLLYRTVNIATDRIKANSYLSSLLLLIIKLLSHPFSSSGIASSGGSYLLPSLIDYSDKTNWVNLSTLKLCYFCLDFNDLTDY